MQFECLRFSSSMLFPGIMTLLPAVVRPEMNFLHFGKGAKRFSFSFVEDNGQ
jgi:hypothetical protein